MSGKSEFKRRCSLTDLTFICLRAIVGSRWLLGEFASDEGRLAIH